MRLCLSKLSMEPLSLENNVPDGQSQLITGESLGSIPSPAAILSTSGQPRWWAICSNGSTHYAARHPDGSAPNVIFDITAYILSGNSFPSVVWSRRRTRRCCGKSE